MSFIFVKHFEWPCVERCYINKLALPSNVRLVKRHFKLIDGRTRVCFNNKHKPCAVQKQKLYKNNNYSFLYANISPNINIYPK